MAIINNNLISMLIKNYDKVKPVLDVLNTNIDDKLTFLYEKQNTSRTLSVFSWLHHSVEKQHIKNIWDNNLSTQDKSYIDSLMNELIQESFDITNIEIFSYSVKKYCEKYPKEEINIEKRILSNIISDKEQYKLIYLIKNDHFLKSDLLPLTIKKVISHCDNEFILNMVKSKSLMNNKFVLSFAIQKLYLNIRGVIEEEEMKFCGDKIKNLIVELIKSGCTTDIKDTFSEFSSISKERYGTYYDIFFDEINHQPGFMTEIQEVKSLQDIIIKDKENFSIFNEIFVAFENSQLNERINVSKEKREKERL